MTASDKNKNFMNEVVALIEGGRSDDYGDSEVNHQRIADMWSVILQKPIEPHEVYLCMIAVKMSRLTESPKHRDSWLDIAGYAALAEKN
jgi:hypothetical protein|tara:strand:- start:208 stop:474 length:267 start_codon:yes stop_codon:yes gene_type:complete